MTAGDRVPNIVIGVAPALLAVAFVLVGFVNNAVPLDQLWRPLLVAVAVAVVIQAILVLAIGWERGSFWAFVAVSALAGLFVLAGAAVLALTLFGFVTRERQYRLGGLLATGVAVALVAAQVAGGVSQGAFDWRPVRLAAPEVGSLSAGPNVHLLLLDGYPRQDVLDGLGFDNDAFLSAMAERGFEVYPESRSNYDRTPFSLLTLLTLRHLDDIQELEGAAAGAIVEQERIAGRALLGVPLFDLVEAAGYHTRVVEGPVVHVPIGGANEVTSAGSATNFELDTLQRTPLAAPLEALGIAMGQARGQVTGALALFAEPPESPAFTFTHVMAPHAPFSVEADGSDAPAPPCYPETCAIFDGQDEGLGWSEDEHWQRMVGHVAHLNDLVIEAVDELLAADPDAVIVIFGDHGMRVAGDPENIYRNLLLARTPGHRGLFGEAPTLVNVVPHLLNAYLGADMALLPDDLYTGGSDPWLEAQPYLPSGAP
jgi:MFS family permease